MNIELLQPLQRIKHAVLLGLAAVSTTMAVQAQTTGQSQAGIASINLTVAKADLSTGGNHVAGFGSYTIR